MLPGHLAATIAHELMRSAAIRMPFVNTARNRDDNMMSGEESPPRQVVRYLAERSRNLHGGWVSLADLRGALGFELEAVRTACQRLHARGLAELMGGFPIRPMTDKFTLVRLSDAGMAAAADPTALERALADSG
jgi:hypothetical protein